jgi:Tol biopolymer transport system component
MTTRDNGLGWALLLAAGLAGSAGCAAVGGAAPTGGSEEIADEDAERMKAVGGKVKGQIVWSSSRDGNHDLFVMNTDGGGVKRITEGDAVDWFPRYSPDGSRILFVRSKKGWVSERDANAEGKWDLYTLPAEGGTPKKAVDDASWGTWVDEQTILFVRGTKIFRQKLQGDGEPELLVDSQKQEVLDGALLQQPQMSSDGRFIAITLRGSKRETGIWDVNKQSWMRTGDGCQINWTPDGQQVYWVHPTGNGGSRVFRQQMANGKPTKEVDDDAKTFIDLPGRRSHEYFPELSDDGSWLVWAATQRGHDHDIADYEVYLWQVGQPPEQAARLTFHSGNDRWPDIFVPGADAAGAKQTPGELDKEPAQDGGEAVAAVAGEAEGEQVPAAKATKKSKAKKSAKVKGRGKARRRR